MSNEKDNPCVRECPERSPTCHAECKRYEFYIRKHAAERNKRWREDYINEQADRARIEHIEKTIKRSHKK